VFALLEANESDLFLQFLTKTRLSCYENPTEENAIFAPSQDFNFALKTSMLIYI
jgi:hypothetical protein